MQITRLLSIIFCLNMMKKTGKDCRWIRTKHPAKRVLYGWVRHWSWFSRICYTSGPSKRTDHQCNTLPMEAYDQLENLPKKYGWNQDRNAPDLATIVQIKPDPFCTGSDRSILSKRKLYGKTDVLPNPYFKTLDTVRYLKSRLSIAHQEGGEQP